MMNGVDLMDRLIDDLRDSRDFIKYIYEPSSDAEKAKKDNLIAKIRRDLNMYYDYTDSFDAMLEDIEIDDEY